MANGINLNVILVGSSPLPCYIQAQYILERGSSLESIDHILFVATNEADAGTEKYVTNIESILYSKKILDHGKCDRLLIEDGYNSYQIEEEVFEKLREINSKTPIENILLNNTGGTKAMAVYATSSIRKFADKEARRITITECFVDPKQNRLRCYKLKENVADLYPEDGTLKDYVRLDISDLIRLHYGQNVRISYSDTNGAGGSDKKKKFEPMDEEQMQYAQKILSDRNAYEQYEDFFAVCEKFGKGKKNKRAESIVEQLKNEGKLSLLNDLFSWTEGEYHFLPFIDGDWLELYFYQALLDAKRELEEKGISIQTGWSCKVKPDEQFGKEFEVDILALRGYELTLFSVSMADKPGLAKGKWFEAVYRTEQMAGEHGKVAVVNFLCDKESCKNIEAFKADLKTFKREVEIYDKNSMSSYEDLVRKLVNQFE